MLLEQLPETLTMSMENTQNAMNSVVSKNN